MQNGIKNITLSLKCDADWNSMPAANGGRHCNSCQKTVYDFTNAKANEFVQILAENNNNICGRFRAAQVAPIHVPTWQKWASAALVLIGINALNNKTYAQGIPKKAPERVMQIPADVIVGKVAAPTPIADFPGGWTALTKFLSKNIRYPENAIAGKVFATFIVKKDGTVTDIQLIRHLSPANDMEAIRVLKLLPKWIPAKQDGKPVDSRFVLPVTFGKVK